MTNRKTKADHQLILQEGEPLLFGAQKEKGIVFNAQKLCFEVALVEDVGLEAIYVHDPKHPFAAKLLAELALPDFPVPLGILHQENRMCYDQAMSEQIQEAQNTQKISFQELLESGETWEVK